MGEGNNRFVYLTEQLAKEHNVSRITSNFNHGSKAFFSERIYPYPFKMVLLHETGYPENVRLKRFYSHFIWGLNVRKYLKNRIKPDVIYCASSPLTADFFVAKYCRKRNIRMLIDIQDLWPEGFRMVFNPPAVNSLIYAPFKYLANEVYSAVDEIYAVSCTYVDRAKFVNKKEVNANIVYLGTKLVDFDRNTTDNPCYKPINEFWLGYCGTLGSKFETKK